MLAVADDPAVLAGVAERLPLVAVAPGQVVALELARLRGLDLDHPSGLSKVTSPC